jgi:hypothetical protein
LHGEGVGESGNAGRSVDWKRSKRMAEQQQALDKGMDEDPERDERKKERRRRGRAGEKEGEKGRDGTGQSK